MQCRHGPPAQDELSLPHIAVQGANSKLVMGRLAGRSIEEGLRPGPVPVMTAPELQGALRIERPNQRDDRPRRDIARAVVSRDIGVGNAGELRFGPDSPAPDPVPVEKHRVQRFPGDGGRGIELAFGFLDNHQQLAREFPGIEQTATEGIRLELYGASEGFGWKYGVIDGVVIASPSIEVTAGGLHFAGDLSDAAAR